MIANHKISGIHHITAIASSAMANVTFFEKVLGLRLVKQTVNFDDPFTYHLYYGDQAGSPGTIITFFPWHNLPRGKTGAGMVASIAFAIPRNSIDYWRERLTLNGVVTSKGHRFGERVLGFEDPDGLPLELIETTKACPEAPPAGNAESDRHGIIGLHSATAVLRTLTATRSLLVDTMGMVLDDRHDNRYRFKTQSDPPLGRFFDVVIDASAAKGRQGGGTVHHIAFRTPTDAEQKDWQKSLANVGFAVTPIRNRKYFKSIYFHEPGGVLFEIATDPPGFGVDEPAEQLGRELKLPAQYEPMRVEIEKKLPALRPN